MRKVKYANKDHFVALARDAERQDFNRQVFSDLCIDDMDPEGTNIIWFSMLHEHKHGYRVDPHMRTGWLVKIKDQENPVELWLDMTMENFNALPELDADKEMEAMGNEPAV